MISVPLLVAVPAGALLVRAAMRWRSDDADRGDDDSTDETSGGAGFGVLSFPYSEVGPEFIDPALGGISGAYGWPYYWGKGSPSTPWSKGPEGVDCSGFVCMALVKLGTIPSTTGDLSSRAIADRCDPVEVGQQRPGDVAYYPGHIMLVVGYPDDDYDGHSAVMGASGGRNGTFGTDPNARVKVFPAGDYRSDFVTYGRWRG